MSERNLISIWFFIGMLLLLYGLVIFGANIVALFLPDTGSTVKFQDLHFGIWWGLLLIVIGGIYFINFRPWRRKAG